MGSSYAVIVVTYNRLNLLRECISCIDAQILLPTDVIIVDNFSSDGTKEYLQGLSNKPYRLHTFYFTENMGGAGGFCKGMEIASSLNIDWMLLIDDDAMLPENYLSDIDGVAKLNKDVLAFSGGVKTDGQIRLEHRLKRNATVSLADYEKETFEYDYSTFCGLILHKSLVEKIGLPIKEFFIWCDDAEYSIRIRKVSKIINVNSAYINHKMNTSKKAAKSERLDWKQYYGIRNRLYIVKIHESYFKALRAGIKKKLAYLIKTHFRTKNKEDRRYNYKLIRRAVNDGLKGRLGKNPDYLP